MDWLARDDLVFLLFVFKVADEMALPRASGIAPLSSDVPWDFDLAALLVSIGMDTAYWRPGVSHALQKVVIFDFKCLTGD